MNAPRNPVVRMLNKVVSLIVHGDFAQLRYHAWLRLHRLDAAHINLVSPEDGKPYSNSGGPRLDKVLRSLKIDAGSVLLEYGVGKAIACITLSKYFKRIIGVDLSPALIAVGRENMAKVGVTNVEFHAEDARTFVAGLDDVTHLYMFNPFSREVMVCVIDNLKRSLARKPRTLTVIFLAPYIHDLFVASGFVHVRDFDFGKKRLIQDRFSIYELPCPRPAVLP